MDERPLERVRRAEGSFRLEGRVDVEAQVERVLVPRLHEQVERHRAAAPEPEVRDGEHGRLRVLAGAEPDRLPRRAAGPSERELRRSPDADRTELVPYLLEARSLAVPDVQPYPVRGSGFVAEALEERDRGEAVAVVSVDEMRLGLLGLGFRPGERLRPEPTAAGEDGGDAGSAGGQQPPAGWTGRSRGTVVGNHGSVYWPGSINSS